jgi:cation transport ATPase
MEKMIKYNTKKNEIVELKSIAALVIFFLCMLKYLLVNKLEVLAKYSPTNGFISWVIILPLTIIGFFLSLIIIKKYWSSFKSTFFSYNFLIVLPMFLYSIILLVTIIISLFFR